MALSKQETSQRYRMTHPDKIKAYSDAHRPLEYARHLQRVYGLTVLEYDELFIAQGGKCKVCGKDNSGSTQNGKRKKMCVDHDHITGRVRGLLCNNCNTALGSVHDDSEILIKLVEYLNCE